MIHTNRISRRVRYVRDKMIEDVAQTAADILVEFSLDAARRQTKLFIIDIVLVDPVNGIRYKQILWRI